LLGNYSLTSGFWPRVRARALRAPVFLGSLPRQMGSFAASYSTPKNIYNLSNLGRPRPGLLSFQWTTEAMKYEVPSPGPLIAALLILPAIFLGSNYVAMRPYALIFSVFFIVFGSFLLFSSFSSLLFLFTFFLFFSSYLFLFFS
jgi:hypothetical protein